MQTQIDQKRFDSLRQTGDAATFVHEFNLMADRMNWTAAIRDTIIMQRVKPAIRNHMLLYEREPDDYEERCLDIIRIDELLTLTGKNDSGRKKGGKKPKKGKTQKCAKCGRNNHVTEKCYAKVSVNMISVRGVETSLSTFEIQTTIEGTPRKALVDSGAGVSCIRASLVSGTTFPSTDILEGPTGEVLADKGRYIVETIDGTPQRLYLVPHLRQEVLLGRPYLDNTQSHGMCAFATTGPYETFGRMRELSIPEREAESYEIEKGLANGWIRVSNATQACNTLFVPKKNNRLRMCIDYRPVNEVTRRDGYPLPLIKSTLHQVIGASCFTVLDLEAAFHNIRIMPGQEGLTAFRTSRDVYEYLVMPFGIKNGPSIFQRYIERILEPHRAYCKVYIDDILVYSEDKDTHMTHVKAVLNSLAEHSLKVSLEKTQAALTEVFYLGHKITHGMVEAVIDYKAVRDWPEPRNKTDLQRYLGMANYWRDFVPGMAQQAAPLYALTGNDSFRWNNEHRMAFSALKAAICGDVEIFQMDQYEPLALFFDASGVGLGAMAFQAGRPISILSRGLTPAEKNYTTTEREMLAIVWATKKWRHIIESTRADIVAHTDHKLLTQNWNADYRNRRMNRWLEHLMQLPITYAYVIGEHNPADAPSRRPDFYPERGGEEKIKKLVEEAQPARAFWQRPEHVTPIDKTPATPSHADPWANQVGPTPEEVEAWKDYHATPSEHYPQPWDDMSSDEFEVSIYNPEN
ncbi:MAG: hypothetical protein EOP64_05680 [Sphingomonas sp.]|nr:MAG: hypothetical protein EOP64_05680 [Sphingomonas sp.]